MSEQTLQDALSVIPNVDDNAGLQINFPYPKPASLITLDSKSHQGILSVINDERWRFDGLMFISPWFDELMRKGEDSPQPEVSEVLSREPMGEANGAKLMQAVDLINQIMEDVDDDVPYLYSSQCWGFNMNHEQSEANLNVRTEALDVFARSDAWVKTENEYYKEIHDGGKQDG